MNVSETPCRTISSRAWASCSPSCWSGMRSPRKAWLSYHLLLDPEDRQKPGQLRIDAETRCNLPAHGGPRALAAESLCAGRSSGEPGNGVVLSAADRRRHAGEAVPPARPDAPADLPGPP